MSKSSKSSSSSKSQAASTASAIEDPSTTLIALYDIDDFSAHHCGYCNQNGNISIGMSSECMRIEDYQTLIDRGWRRSGTYIYKPVMDKTCCPLYTIRCDTLNIQLRKSQKATLKTMRRYLEKDERCKLKNTNDDITKAEKQENQNNNLIKLTPLKTPHWPPPNQKTYAQKVVDLFLNENCNVGELKAQQPEKLIGVGKLKSKQKRLFRKLIKLKENNLISSLADVEKYLKRKRMISTVAGDEKSLESYLELCAGDQSVKNKLEIKLVRSWPPSNEFEDTLGEVHKLYTKYQMQIHRDSPLECSMAQFKRFLCTSPLMRTSYPSGTLNKYDNNNGSAVDLATSKLNGSISGNVSAIGYGSFHQHYRINGKLVGVGVVDILNNCLSSVYFFYDPDFQFLNMGTYSALREIAFVRQINKIDPNIRWYYLGYYAHQCRKMRYKGFFHPSYLLCPETYTWHPIDKCVELLERIKYTRFAPSDALDQDRSECIDDVKIRIKLKDQSAAQVFRFREFCALLNAHFVPQFTHLITGYCKLFGKKFSRSVLIKF